MREIHGRTDDLPRAGIQMGDRIALAPPYPVVANFPTREEIAELLHETRWSTAAQVVLLDPGSPTGTCVNGGRPAFRRCGMSPMQCSGSAWRRRSR